MSASALARDVAVGVAAGVVGTKVMDPTSEMLRQRESLPHRRAEERVSNGVPHEVAAKNVTMLATGARLPEEQARRAGRYLHYAVGVGWVPVYMWLRRSRGHGPLLSATTTGAAMFAVVEEVANPMLGFGVLPAKYPAVTRLRGLASHLAYGVAAGATVEAAWSLLGKRP